ncbi:glycosyltransferase family 2 protein [Chitinophaga arvensicola]|uniref:Glycosyl transferase family 2 n=1 Tax=Chitinophaga arvensicola TaxID=29529 RepID=A0A1I0SA39_9BACT|nr:glycosyltransferase family 2 protein [Chitinophaga arvensicola]SEW53189.1 Glycosyl transferase family 2 [Chitinophaga arvensicola]
MDKNVNTPLVTVFMAAFNGEAYIEKAIQSVLNQSFTDFELLIVNDGSTDRTLDIIHQFTDPRIRLVHNDGNKGLTFTRNRGIEEAKGKYIAVLDCDDLATPDRLKSQISFLNSNPEFAICGGQAILIDESGKQTGNLNVMAGDKSISPELVFQNTFINSTLMIKRSAMIEAGGYRDYSPAEDYDLSYRISLHHPVTNLNEVLVAYRLHNNNISKLQEEKVVRAELRIIENIHTNLGIPKDENLIRIHHDYFSYRFSARSSKEFLQVFEALKKGNATAGSYAAQVFNEILYKKWYSLLRHKKEKGVLPLFFGSKLFEWQYVTAKELRKVVKQAFFRNILRRN